MEISFLLKESKKEVTSIRLQARFDGKLFRYPTGITLKSNQWSKSKQKIHSGVPNSQSMNDYLESLKKTVKDEYFNIIAKKETPTLEYLKNILDDNYKSGKKETVYLLDYLDECISSKEKLVEKNTIKGYGTLKGHLIAYEKFLNTRLTLESLTKKFYYAIIDYFAYNIGSKNKTIKENYMKNFNSFINWAVENQYIIKNPFVGIKFPYKIGTPTKIALSEEELIKIFNLDLSNNKRLDWARDLLCFECYSGLRFSDLSNVTPEKFKGNQLDVVIKKTKEQLVIPLCKEALFIINKYFDKDLPFPDKSGQKTNIYLKELGKLVELNEPITSLYFIGSKSHEETMPKYEMMETHTGRRTFVTLSYQKGMTPLDIMAITGHKDYQLFMNYHRLDKIKVHENYHKAWSKIQVKYDLEEIIKNLLIHQVDKKIVALSLGISLEEMEELIRS